MKMGDKEAALRALRSRFDIRSKPAEKAAASVPPAKVVVPVPAPLPAAHEDAAPVIDADADEIARALRFYRKHRERQRLAGLRRRAAKNKT